MENTGVVDPSARRIINRGAGITNIAQTDQDEKFILGALEACRASLQKHCGPQSGYAMLVNGASAGIKFEPNVFTRDGIDILSAIEFFSPLEDYIKQLLTYIGERVDSIAKDGTTTSMLFSALFLQEILRYKKEIQSLNLSVFQMNTLTGQLFDTILDNLNMYVFNLSRLDACASDYTKEQYLNDNELPEELALKYAGMVAFMQALSSSGGNVELAVAMKEIFEKSPKVTWEYISSYHSIKESGASFSVEVDAFDSRIRCVLASKDGMNHALGSEYIAENVRVVCYPDGMEDMNLKTVNVIEYLKTIPLDQPAILITPYPSARVILDVNKINQERTEKIAIWQYSPEESLGGQNYPWELLIICAVAGVTPYSLPTIDASVAMSDEHTFVAKSVHWHDTYLELFGTIDMEENSCLHPFYAHPEKASPYYNDVRRALEKQLESYKDGHKKEGRMFALFMEMLNKLACVHRPTLRLGGPTHEQVANAPIVKDVQGAIMSSLNHGFLINGPLSMWSALYETKRQFGDYTQTPHIQFQTLILDSMLLAMESVLKTVYTTPTVPYEERCTARTMENVFTDADLYINVLSDSNLPFTLNGFLKQLQDTTSIRSTDTTKDISNFLVFQQDYPVVQPVMITKELLRRIKELLLKFIHTNEIIVFGGMMMKEDEHGSGKSV